MAKLDMELLTELENELLAALKETTRYAEEVRELIKAGKSVDWALNLTALGEANAAIAKAEKHATAR